MTCKKFNYILQEKLRKIVKNNLICEPHNDDIIVIVSNTSYNVVFKYTFYNVTDLYIGRGKRLKWFTQMFIIAYTNFLSSKFFNTGTLKLQRFY